MERTIILDPFDQWMVKQNIGYAQQQGIEPGVTNLRSGGYNNVADATATIFARLEELRTELNEERISYGEINELQGLRKYIPTDDVQLFEAAGVREGAATRLDAIKGVTQ